MINTILVEDDLYIQKHFVDRLAADGEFHLVGVFRDAFEAEKHCDATVKLVLMDVQTQRKHSGLAAAERIKKAFPQIKIVGHRDLPGVNKACPSFDVAKWLKSIGIYQ